MLRYAGRRLVQSVFVLFGVSVLVHVSMFVLPGDPLRPQFGVRRPDPAVLAAEHAKWGLDQPWPVQYWRFLRRLLTGDLGQSYVGAPVKQIVASTWQPTVKIALLAVVLQVTGGVLVGSLAARRPGSLLDRATSVSITLLLGIPLMIFAVFAADVMPRIVFLASLDLRLPDVVTQLVMPAATLALVSGAVTARMTRLNLTDQFREAYVQVARAKGLGDGAIVVRHALRNAIVPVVTFIGADVAAMSSTLPVVEKAYYVSGLGARAVTAARDNDTAPLITLVAIFTVVAVLANLTADLVTAALDPRRRELAPAR